MQLKIFKTLWGCTDSLENIIQEARDKGYHGIEGPVPVDQGSASRLKDLLVANKLEYIAEVATTGTFVPDRSLPMTAHLDYLEHRLRTVALLEPLFINCLGGADAWTLQEKKTFLSAAMELADKYEQSISFETHRGRCLFTPWTTLELIEQIPGINISCDFSHWCVVCEGMQLADEPVIQRVIECAMHIHGRIGYDQGPQVPDPRTQVYSQELQQHMLWWKSIWQRHLSRGFSSTTITPEFGVDGYDYRDPVSGQTLIEPTELNDWMAGEVRNVFSKSIN